MWISDDSLLVKLLLRCPSLIQWASHHLCTGDLFGLQFTDNGDRKDVIVLYNVQCVALAH